MIYSNNSKPPLEEFSSLMKQTDDALNRDARMRPGYYASRGGNPLEDDVTAALEVCSKGTPFENTIKKVSGHKFPDIVAARYYGVEVKSTKEDHWTSTGSSILETTRISDVERIFMTFGKLGGNPIQFLSKRYEECLYGIAVTHMPRYLINMQLQQGETIFDKMGIPYDELRQMDNPIAPVSKYYRSQLKPGESLWWAGDSHEEAVSATIRLWKTLSPEEKREHMIHGCVNFPEIFAGDYDNYSLWLTSQGVVDPHIRDQFSAGGREDMIMSDGRHMKFPAVYRRVKENLFKIICLIASKGIPLPIEYPPIRGESLKMRVMSWCDAVSMCSSMAYDESMDALTTLFFGAANSTSVINSKQIGRSPAISKPVIPSFISSRSVCCVKTCKSCGREYKQEKSQQLEGHRFKEDDVCPYCGIINNQSMEWEYHNTKIEK